MCVCVCVYIYIYIYVCVCVYIYIYIYMYVYVLLSYFGPAVLHPLPTFPSHYKSDLRKEQHSGLTLISQHLLGLMCDPTEGGMAIELDSGTQRLP